MSLTFIAKEANSTIALQRDGELEFENQLMYRTDNNAEWEQYEYDTVITLTNVYDYVQFKNLGSEFNSESSYAFFVMTGSIDA